MNQKSYRIKFYSLTKLPTLLMVLFLLGTTFQAFAQRDYYYYYGNDKLDLQLSGEYVYVVLTDNNRSVTDLNTALGSEIDVFQMGKDESIESLKPVAGTPKATAKNWAILHLRDQLAPKDYQSKMDELKSKDMIEWASPFFEFAGDDMVGLSQYFYVKLRQKEDLEMLRGQCKLKGAQIVGQNKYMPLWYTLQVNTRHDKTALDLANQFYESGRFAHAEPSLMVGDFGLNANDPLFPDQWALENTGQNGWTVGIDANAGPAWEISTGSRDIVVAVLDQGIELNHPDLAENAFPNSFNTITNTSPSVVYGNHGTACGGIVAASRNNNTGVSGIAPNVRLMDVSHTLTFTPNVRQELANGINWAWMNGADVISNSWGSNALASVLIDNAIANALSTGRGGLGTVVVFAAGNTNSSVIYPASSNPDIVAVAAMSPCGERKNPASCDLETFWGSSFGAQIDVMAPGVKIPTTDRQGALGYSPTDYAPAFNGTSSACPLVAGISGLILSINPCMNHDQVEDILELTTQKVGGYPYAITAGRPNGTWFNETGYGLVDAQACILAARGTLPSGSNFDLICRDRPFDTGLEPNPDTGPMWISQDIWVRRDLDGAAGHQNPEFKLYSPNGVYVRITNTGTATSPCALLGLYYSKASTGLVWPQHWNNFNIGTVEYGDLVNVVSIPPVAPGASYVAEIPWYPPNPADFVTDIHHFCLAARVLSPSDPMFNEQNNVSIFPNVKRNNNICWKNVSVFDVNPTNFQGTHVSVFVRSTNLSDAKVNLSFHDKGFSENIDYPFFSRGGVAYMYVDPEFFEILMQSDLIDIEPHGSNSFIIKSREARFNSVVLKKGVDYPITFKFELPDYSAGEEVILDLIQETAGSGRMEGGERFVFTSAGYASLNDQTKPEVSLRQITNDDAFLTPNPVSDLLTLQYEVGAEDAEVVWEMMDISGRQVMGANLGEQFAQGTYTEMINVSDLTPGVYFVQLRIGDEVRTEKLIVE